MKTLREIPTTNKELSEKLVLEGWTKLKEPKDTGKAILLSFPFLLINTGLCFAIILYLHAPLRTFLNSSEGFNISFPLNLIALIYIAGVLLFTGVHEVIHAAFIPKAWESDKTFWGINVFYGFIYTTEIIKKSRFILISIMPFILLSLILPFLLNALGWLNSYTILLCLINAGGSCIDSLGIYLVTTQVPKDAHIISNGMETYFK